MARLSSSWSVVATVDEPPALVQAFVAWHLHLGAETVYLYCDNPTDPVAAMLAHLPDVRLTLCDDAYWRRAGKSRPRRHQVRQVRNARDAYAGCGADWIIHMDADEFLWPRDSVGTILAGVAPGADAVVVSVAERVHRADDPGRHVLEGAFRHPFRKPPKTGLRLFGPDYALTSRGLTGHALGKTFVRKGRDLNLSIHRPRAIATDAEPVMSRPASDTIALLHFDGLTPRHWVYKLARMQRALKMNHGMPPSAHRRAQADALLADPAGGAALYARLKVTDATMQARLARHGLWSAAAFDPFPALARYFPDQPIDLSAAAVDGWLAAQKPDVIAFLDKAGDAAGD